jgi:hypothetical protein
MRARKCSANRNVLIARPAFDEGGAADARAWVAQATPTSVFGKPRKAERREAVRPMRGRQACACAAVVLTNEGPGCGCAHSIESAMDEWNGARTEFCLSGANSNYLGGAICGLKSQTAFVSFLDPLLQRGHVI